MNFSTNVAKCYVHIVGSTQTLFGFQFISQGLVPSSTCKFYYDDYRYIGSSKIKELQSGDEHIATIGPSTIVTCKSYVERSDSTSDPDQDSIIVNEKIYLKFNNKNTVQVGAKIKHYIGDAELLNITVEPQKREEGYLIWMADVSSGESKYIINSTMKVLK